MDTTRKHMKQKCLIFLLKISFVATETLNSFFRTMLLFKTEIVSGRKEISKTVTSVKFELQITGIPV